MLSRRNVVI